MVLSSLHTKDAPSALTRLADLGVESFRISAAVSLIVAQRLVRVICEKCKTPAEPDPHILDELGLDEEELVGAQLFKGAGCDACEHTGYQGRTGIFELLPITPNLREAVAGGLDEQKMAIEARREGMSTLLQNGVRKMRAGITSLEELHRVLQAARAVLPQCIACHRHVLLAADECPHCGADLSGEGTVQTQQPPLKIVENGV
jgi:type II secretory ATPase GspE/PulE/Tfp pilus assembly ATPase PilB-like protein